MRSPRAYSASDYAGVRAGRFDFYYGYESAVRDEDGESGPWLFVARENGKEVFKATADELGVGRSSCEVVDVLLEGVAAFFERRFPKEQP